MSNQDLDRRLAGWFDSSREDYVPQGLLDDVFSVTRVSRQRRGPVGRLVTAAIDTWRAPVISRVPPQVVYLALAALLVLATALAIAAIGASRPAPPFGLAANGLIAFELDGTIVIARPDGTEVSRVTAIPDARGPVFSPDGTRLAFFGTVDGDATIMVASADGRGPIAISTGIVIDRSVLKAPDGNDEPTISWSPDSHSITFSGLSGERPQLFVANVDGSDTHPIGDAALSRLDPAWSPDGAWIAFHGFQPNEDAAAGQYRTNAGLYVIRPDGREQQQLAYDTGGDFLYRRPQWLPSPERSVLAYAVGEPGAYDIAVFDLDTMQQKVISRNDAAETWPVWAPDGSTLAWVTSDGNIRVARPDGTIVRIFPSAIDYELVWSPDGRSLLGYTNESRTGMSIMSSDGSSATTSFPIDGRSRSYWSWQRLAP